MSIAICIAVGGLETSSPPPSADTLLTDDSGNVLTDDSGNPLKDE